MKVLGVLSLVGVALGKVHDFWAEHNFICSACEDAVNFACNGGNLDNFMGCLDPTGKEYTNTCFKVRSNAKRVKNMCGSYTVNGICRELSLCDDWEDDEFDNKPAWNKKIIDEINNDPDSTWKAGMPGRFKGLTLGAVKRTMLGSVVDENHVYRLPHDVSTLRKTAPASFDARQEWPYCASVIGNIRDQSACGSCWAFGSTEAFEDRTCIVSGSTNTFLQLLSVEDTNSCCTGATCGYSNGCNGGQPTAAWTWFERSGVPSGGNYSDLNMTDTCEPYTLPPCAHHEPSNEYPDCPSREYRTPSCVSKCINEGYSKSWADDKHYSQGGYSVRGVSEIMTEIATYGTVSASFTVYEDFLTYTSGVYVHKTGSAVGGHAIKILGYGTENGQDYWLCANSWNDSWGDKGYFKILKGKDECGIEGNIGAGHPKQ